MRADGGRAEGQSELVGHRPVCCWQWRCCWFAVAAGPAPAAVSASGPALPDAAGTVRL